MDFSHYNGQPVDMAVELVNTLDAATGEETLITPADVAVFVDSHDNTEWCRPDWEPTERDLHEVRALRSRLRDVFETDD